MQKIGLFYTDKNLSSQILKEQIEEKMSGLGIDFCKLDSCIEHALEKYDLLVFGVPVWHDGDLEDDWADYIKNLNEENLLNKTVAIFGLGEIEISCKNFLEAMKSIYATILANGSKIIGSWPNQDYNLTRAISINQAQISNNYSEDSDANISKWIELITPYFSK